MALTPPSATLSSSALGNSLQSLLMCDDIEPGSEPSWQICREIYLYHPIGKKMVDAPIAMAQSQKREISVPDSPEDDVRDAFTAKWEELKIDDVIASVLRLSRIYGLASVAMLVEGVEASKPVDYAKLYGQRIAFNVFDPLNTAGSLVLDQNPNSFTFMKPGAIAVSGTSYHPSRSRTIMNETPMYIAYTTSSFGFVGRSVFQRALFPLKSFIQTMVTDDMVSRKAGMIVAMMAAAGSIIDNVMKAVQGIKRVLLQSGGNNNVLSIGKDEKIESLDLTNIGETASIARKNILENIAVSADMPAQLLNSETFAEGFGEGTEDSKNVARYIDGIRLWAASIYQFFDEIVMYLAWNEEFYKTIQAKFPEQYESVSYNEAFFAWKNSFSATWPSLLIEPESEQSKNEKVRLDSLLDGVKTLAPMLDPLNKSILIRWFADNMNSNKLMFQTPLVLDYDALENYEPPQIAAGDGEEDEPFTKADAQQLFAGVVAQFPRETKRLAHQVR